MSGMEDLNPYAAPMAELLTIDADANRVRYEHLRTESHLKAVAWFILVLGISSLISGWMIQRIKMREFGIEPGLEVIPWHELVMAGASILTGLGLMRLQNWAGISAVVLSVVWLFLNVLRLPYSWLGITIHILILRFLFQGKTRFILAAPYQAILRQTPLIESPVATWIKLVIALFAFGLIISVWATFR